MTITCGGSPDYPVGRSDAYYACVTGVWHWQTALESTRTVFGKHRAGYVFPMLLYVKALPSGFMGMIQQLQTTDEFLLFTSKSKRIVGGTQDTLRLLGNGMNVEDSVVMLDQVLSDAQVEKLMKSVEDSARGMRSDSLTEVAFSLRVSLALFWHSFCLSESAESFAVSLLCGQRVPSSSESSEVCSGEPLAFFLSLNA